VRRLEKNFPSADLSCRIAIGSDLPPAAGISSSSALVVSLAEVLIARGGLENTPEWKAAIQNPEDRAGYFGCIENGSAFGALAGDTGVGTHGGSEDHAAILMGREGALLQFSFSPLRLERSVTMPEGWTFVVLSSGIRASKASGARAEYNRLAAEAAELRTAWRQHDPDDGRTLAELARAGVLDALELAPRLAERLAHLEAEDARVIQAADAFERGDLHRLGELAHESQRDAERWLQNQVPQTSDLVAIARDIGAAAASAFGAGWGGSVWALVRTSEAEAFLNTWIAAYEARHPRCRARGFVSYPSNGLQPL
jgi:galactokinase